MGIYKNYFTVNNLLFKNYKGMLCQGLNASIYALFISVVDTFLIIINLVCLCIS